MRGAGHPAGERREYRYRRDACRRHGRVRARAGALRCATGSAHTARGPRRGLRSVGSAPCRVNIYEVNKRTRGSVGEGAAAAARASLDSRQQPSTPLTTDHATMR